MHLRLLVIVLILNITLPVFGRAQTVQTDTFAVLTIEKISIIGNRKTKRHIILRELTFAEGDTIKATDLAAAMERSKYNLVNTSLFTTINVNRLDAGPGKTEIVIIVSERWYLWPRLIFELAETNFNSWWENKDFTRINYGVEVTQSNFRGRNEKLRLLVQLGFTEKLGVGYKLPYINKKQTLGLDFSMDYGQNHEVNYISEDNKRLFYKDIESIQQRFFKSALHLTYRRKLYNKSSFGILYRDTWVSDSVRALNPNYLDHLKQRSNYLALTYRFVHDKRDNISYALTGHYFNGEIFKYGLGLLDNQLDLLWTRIEYKKFWKLKDRLYLSASAQGRFFFNDIQPYFIQDGLGYTDKSTVRAYELYVIDGQQMAIGKVQFRYQLITPKVREIGIIPFRQFRKIGYSAYLGLFSDLGFVNDDDVLPQNLLANDPQYGSGVSLDVAGYYDMVFRMEYSINKFGEHGLFLHFASPI